MDQLRAQFRELALPVFLHPTVGGVATVFGVIAGYLGSHYDKLIFASKYPFFWPDTTFTVEASWFWAFTIMFGMSFTGTFWAQSVTSNKTNAELQEALKELVTVPPRGFIHSYKTYCVSALEFFTALAPQSIPTNFPAQDLQEAIRVQLDILLKTVSAYDSSGVGTIYGANIMLFHGASTPYFIANKAALQSRTKCIEAGVDIGNLTGVLDLQLALSVRSDTNGGVDDRLTQLALPIPMATSGASLASHNAIVPGAPYAFAKQGAIVYVDQQELLNKINANNYFTVTVANELRQILGAQAKDVQSMICVPLFPANPSQVASAPIAVLNIHKNIADKQAAGKFVLLGPLLAPMTRILGNLVEEL